MNLSGNCFKCGVVLSAPDYGRSESCPKCISDTRVCRNCVHYAPGLSSECREPAADLIQGKERANFCEFFKPGQARAEGAPAPLPAADGAKSAFDKLFNSKK